MHSGFFRRFWVLNLFDGEKRRKVHDVSIEETNEVFSIFESIIELVDTFVVGLLGAVELLGCLECGMILVGGFVYSCGDLLQRL